jgi:hypothetical protein
VLWDDLRSSVPDHSARALVVQQIINRRSERDRASQLQAERLAQRHEENARGQRSYDRAMSRLRATAERVGIPATTPPPAQPTVDLGKPKQRKIKLGD